MKRNFIRIISAELLVCFLLTACAGAEGISAEGISAERSTITVDILATSDVHGWFVPYDFPSNKESSKGGLTLISSLVEDFRGQGKNVILADCGDSVQANLCEWLIDEEQHPVMTAFNTMGYDLWTFGNHEFNFSKAQRDNLVKQFNGAVLCGNVFEKGAETSELPATAVIERDGIRIGFIGMTTPLIQDFEKTSGRLDDYNVRNPLEVLRPAIDELKAQKADCIVGLIHEGLYEERGVYGSSIRDIAKEFPEFDVIIGGHTHEAVECEYENGVLLCQPGVYAQTVSDIELSFTAADDGAVLTGKTSRIIPCGSENDAELYDALLPYKQRISDIMDSEIGELKGAGLSADSGIKGLSGVYTQASGIMNLFGSAAMYYSGADCALFCTDNEYAGFPEGPIKISDIMNSFTYSAGEVTVYELSGAQLRRILEWCGDYYNRMEDGDLLPSYNPARRAGKYSTNYLASGISFEVDLTAESGSCVKNLSLIRKNGSCTPDFAEDGSLQLLPIADSDTVKLATTQYAMEGSWAGEGCILAGADIPCVFSSTEEYGESEGTVRSLTIKYIRDVCGGEVDGSQFAYDNWKLITGVDQNSEEYKTAVRMINSGTLELHSSEAGDTNIRSVSVNDIIQK